MAEKTSSNMLKIKREEIQILSDDDHHSYEPSLPASNGRMTVATTTNSSSATTTTTASFATTATGNETHATSATIDEEDLQLLSVKHASKVKYPPECPVWYNLGSSGKRRLDACRGVVDSVYIHLEKGVRAYKVGVRGNIDNNGNGNNNNHTEHKGHLFFWQDQLSYAMNCPVRVRGMIGDDPQKELDGVIVCPKPTSGKTTYAVQFLMEENRIRVELGVESKMIEFRQVETKQRKSSLAVTNMNNNDTATNHSSKQNTGEEEASPRPRKQSVSSLKIVSDCSSSFDGNGTNLRNNAPLEIQANSNGKDVHNQVNPLKRNASSMVDSRPYSESATATPSSFLPAIGERISITNNHRPPKNHPAVKIPKTANSHTYRQMAMPRGNTGHETMPLSLGAPTTPDSPSRIVALKSSRTVALPPLTTARSCHPRENQRREEQQKQQHQHQHQQQQQQQPKVPQPQQHDDYCRMTVPLWVTDWGRSKNLFHHIIGDSDNDKVQKGYKTRAIEKETGCAVEISHLDSVKRVPIYLTIKLTESSKCGRGFDLVRAKEMVEESLIEFVECDGAKARLLYELALSLDGGNLRRLENGIVQQRCNISNNLVWMKIVEHDSLSSVNTSDLLSLNENIERRIQTVEKCSVEIFAHGLNNMKTPVSYCKPFVLICGKSTESVGEATRLVSDALKEYLQPSQNEAKVDSNSTRENSPMSKYPRVSPAKRKAPPSDGGSLSSLSHDQCYPVEYPRKSPKLDEDNSVIKHKSNLSERNNKEAICVLTVPLWVLNKCNRDQDLFLHLVGNHKGFKGHKHKEICSKSNCLINFSPGKSKDCEPMFIKIKSKHDATNPFRDVKQGLRMIKDSLVEFIDDECSERRLSFELAMHAEGSYKFRKARVCVQQECHIAHRMVWMALVELPSAESNGERTPHGRFFLMDDVQHWLKGDTNCSVEVYGFGDNLMLCEPYVLICGNCPDEVGIVADRVANKIYHHRQKCRYCRFF